MLESIFNFAWWLHLFLAFNYVVETTLRPCVHICFVEMEACISAVFFFLLTILKVASILFFLLACEGQFRHEIFYRDVISVVLEGVVLVVLLVVEVALCNVEGAFAQHRTTHRVWFTMDVCLTLALAHHSGSAILITWRFILNLRAIMVRSTCVELHLWFSHHGCFLGILSAKVLLVCRCLLSGSFDLAFGKDG